MTPDCIIHPAEVMLTISTLETMPSTLVSDPPPHPVEVLVPLLPWVTSDGTVEEAVTKGRYAPLPLTRSLPRNIWPPKNASIVRPPASISDWLFMRMFRLTAPERSMFPPTDSGGTPSVVPFQDDPVTQPNDPALLY